MIFKYINDSHISINMNEFLKGQKVINDRFPNPNRVGKFINDYDNMVGQISEEVFETKEAISMNLEKGFKYQTDNSIEEFIDSFMFLGSLIIETAEYFNIDINEFLKNNNLNEIIITDHYINGRLNERCLPHTDFLSYIRRLIIDRKYHKQPKEKPENYEEDLLRYIIVGSIFPRRDDPSSSINNYKLNKYKIPKFIDNFNPYIQDLLFCYDNGYCRSDTDRKNNIIERIATLNHIINYKQGYIANL